MINIDDLLGIRYKTNGRDSNGYDCYGLAIEVEKRFGHKLPDMEEFLKKDRVFENCKDLALKKVTSQVKQVKVPEKEGDVILFNDGSILNHIGIYLGNDKYIHCNKYGVHIESVSSCMNIGKVYTWL